MAKIAKKTIFKLILFLTGISLIKMVVFPTLPQRPDGLGTNRRISQRGILPETLKRRFQPAEGRAITAIVSTRGRAGGDFSDIQEAINFTNNLGGGRILIMPGTYHIKSNITLYDDISIEGLSRNDVILDFNSSTTASIKAVGTAGSDKKNIKLKTMIIKNNHNATEGALYFEWMDNLVIEDISFIDNRDDSGDGYDIYLKEGGDFISIRNCYGEGGATFVRALTGVNNIIKENNMESYNNYVIWGTESGSGAQQIIIEKNRISNCTKGAFYGRLTFSNFDNNLITGELENGESIIALTSGSSENSFVGNYINTDEMILNIDAGSNRFSNNVLVTNGTVTAIDIESTANYFSNNNIFQNGDSGNAIDLAAADCLFSSNNIYSKNGSCIIVGASAHFCAFGANKIRALGGYAVDIVAGATATTVVGNYLEGSTADTRDGGTNSVIAHNGT